MPDSSSKHGRQRAHDNGCDRVVAVLDLVRIPGVPGACVGVQVRGDTKAAILCGAALFLGIVGPGLATAHADSGDFLFHIYNDDDGIEFTGPGLSFLNIGHRICTASVNGYGNEAISDRIYVGYDFDGPSARRLVVLAEDYLC